MGSLRTILPVVALGIGLSAPAGAADLLPPPPIEPVPAVADIGAGWYLRGGIGYAVFTKPADQPYGVPVPPLDRERLADVWSLGGGVGYRCSNWFRADVTADYRGESAFQATSSRTHYVEGFSTDRARLQSSTLLLNGYFDLGSWFGVTPYVGAGIGVAQNRFHDYFGQVTCITSRCGDPTPGAVYALGPQPTLSPIPSRTTSELAWALMAGAAVDIGHGLALDMGYRFVRIGEPRTRFDEFGVGTKLKDQAMHELRLGLRWTFASAFPGPAPLPIAAKY